MILNGTYDPRKKERPPEAIPSMTQCSWDRTLGYGGLRLLSFRKLLAMAEALACRYCSMVE
jgi:hypothetical protein